MRAAVRSSALLLVAGFAACGGSPAEASRDGAIRGATMGTTYVVKFVGEGDRDWLQGEIENTLEHVNKLFSTYDPESEISRFNAHESTEPFACSEEFLGLVRASVAMAIATEGAFDPTVFPVVDLYGFGPSGERREPSPEELTEALKSVGHDKLTLGELSITKTHPDVQLDLSAMAKGYGVDCVASTLRRAGVDSFMVEIGGEVRCAGVKESGQPWQIGIEGPGETRLADTVSLLDAALATSGSYRNYLETGDGAIHHIVDRRTGRNPNNGVVSASVLAPNCALADALATAFMVLGPERAEEVFQRIGRPGVAALFLVEREGGGVQSVGVRW